MYRRTIMSRRLLTSRRWKNLWNFKWRRNIRYWLENKQTWITPRWCRRSNIRSFNRNKSQKKTLRRTTIPMVSHRRWVIHSILLQLRISSYIKLLERILCLQSHKGSRSNPATSNDFRIPTLLQQKIHFPSHNEFRKYHTNQNNNHSNTIHLILFIQTLVLFGNTRRYCHSYSQERNFWSHEIYCLV